LPSLFSFAFTAAAGGWLSYGPNFDELYDQSVGYVDRIFRGARPADLPVEMPRKLDLVINLKTATTLGLKMPQSLLLRADEVIR